MLGYITPGLELLMADRALVGPLVFRPVRQQVLGQGRRVGQHLGALWARDRGLGIVHAALVHGQRSALAVDIGALVTWPSTLRFLQPFHRLRFDTPYKVVCK